MSIRNFWIEVEIDGKKEFLKGGPKSEDGGFSLSLSQRKDGKIRRVIKIQGIANKDGTLTTHIKSQGTGRIITTRR